MADDNAIFACGKTFSKILHEQFSSVFMLQSLIIYNSLLTHFVSSETELSLLYPCLNTVFFTMVCKLICSDASD